MNFTSVFINGEKLAISGTLEFKFAMPEFPKEKNGHIPLEYSATLPMRLTGKGKRWIYKIRKNMRNELSTCFPKLLTGCIYLNHRRWALKIKQAPDL